MPLNKDSLKLSHLLDWCGRDKGMVLALLTIPLELFFTAWLLLTHEYTDFGRTYFTLWGFQWLFICHALAALGWLILFFLGYQLRRRDRNPGWYLTAVVHFYGISLVPQGYIIGLMTPLVGIILLGSALVGFVLFDFRRVFTAFMLALAFIAGLSVLTIQGTLEYAPLFAREPISKSHVSAYWAVSQFILALPFVAGAFSLNQMLLGRWRERERAVQQLSMTDELTGLPNRRQIMTVIEHEWARAERKGFPLTLVMLDLDHFKQVNDVYGHGVGDQMLKKTAAVLRRSIRDADWVGRYGGEEFLLMLPNTHACEALPVVERCRQGVESMSVPLPDGTALTATASFGVHAPVAGTESLEQALQFADQALYRAKHSGRNQYCLSSDAA